MHGDLYAHNILVRPEFFLARDFAAIPDPKLGDFGASFFYDATPSSPEAAPTPTVTTATASGFEALEVRAFGCLVEELVSRVALVPGDAEAAVEALVDVQRACCAPVPATRPTFARVATQLAALLA